MQAPLDINYTYTKNPYEANKLLRNLPELVACDFEAASKFTEEEKEFMKQRLERESNQNSLFSHSLRQKINSDGLSHPSLAQITHFSVAWSETDSLIIITDTPKMKELVLNWLVTTSSKQVWHNAGFDFQHIYYNTGKFPKSYEDTQILAKTILNHVDVFKSRVGLKELMGYKYGDWAVSADSFHLDRMYDEDVIKYAGIDACATYALYQEMIQYIQGLKND